MVNNDHKPLLSAVDLGRLQNQLVFDLKILRFVNQHF